MILGRYHAVAAMGTVLALLGGGVAARASWIEVPKDKGPDLGKLDAIEVSVARPAAPARQPQKRHREKVHQADKGVAHDDKQPPDHKKPKDKPQQKPDDDQDGPVTHIDDSDEPVGMPTHDMGAFNPNKFGNAAVDTGTPYMRDVVSGILSHWSYPKILQGQGTPVMCVHLDPSGKVVDTKFKTRSGDAELDDSVERAIKAFQADREKTPKPVTDSRDLATITGWICLKFDLGK